MASIDYQDYQRVRVGPRTDRLGVGFFLFHALVGTYVLFGWMIPHPGALYFYLLLLALMATQWRINDGSCVLNNIESWLRTGRWRDPDNPEEGAFLLMLCHWWFRARPHSLVLERFSYATVFVLWLLAFSHLTWISMA